MSNIAASAGWRWQVIGVCDNSLWELWCGVVCAGNIWAECVMFFPICFYVRTVCVMRLSWWWPKPNKYSCEHVECVALCEPQEILWTYAFYFISCVTSVFIRMSYVWLSGIIVQPVTCEYVFNIFVFNCSEPIVVLKCDTHLIVSAQTIILQAVVACSCRHRFSGTPCDRNKRPCHCSDMSLIQHCISPWNIWDEACGRHSGDFLGSWTETKRDRTFPSSDISVN